MTDAPRTMTIGGRRIGPGEPVFVVAELSANHRQDFEAAKALVDAAADAGADAVKLQTYTADTITLDCDGAPFLIGGDSPWAGRRLHELYEEASTPWAWHAPLAAHAAERGLLWFSSPFDPTAVAFLETLGTPAHKVASFELVDLPLLRCIAATHKPIIASTGMATLDEIEEAVTTLRACTDAPLALLRTNSGYPAKPEEMDLRTMVDLRERFDVVVGLSDHTLGTAVPVAAVALGAHIVEKHLTLRRADGGPDAGFSLEPEEFAEMCRSVRTAEQALGTTRYGPSKREAGNLRFRRSLFVVRDIRAGERFTAEHVRSIRPSDGLHTRHLEEVLGRCAAVDVTRGTPLAWTHVAPPDRTRDDGR